MILTHLSKTYNHTMSYSYSALYNLLHFDISSYPNIQESINQCSLTQQTGLKLIRDKKVNEEYNAKMVYSKEGQLGAVRGCENNIRALTELKFTCGNNVDINVGRLYPNDQPLGLTVT